MIREEDNVFTTDEIDLIRITALKSGFTDVKFISAFDPDVLWQKKYREYIKKGYHASMKYLENIQPKFSIKKIYESVKTIAVFSLPYIYEDFSEDDRGQQSPELNSKSKYSVARYAYGRDYHLVVKEKLECINAFAQRPGRIVCDTTPFPERYYGALSEIGFIGKNAMLIQPESGSYFFLAFILFDSALPTSLQKTQLSCEYEAKINSYCGICEKCIKACPGGALDGSGFLNSQRCYSFWSIENKLDVIGHKFRKMNSVFGCDICQDVCPYNAKPKTSSDPAFKISDTSRKIMKGDFENLSLKDTSYERTGISGLNRNMAYLTTESQRKRE